MKKVLIFTVLIALFGIMFAERTFTLFETDFMTDDHGWIRVNGTHTNRWHLGTVAHGPGSTNRSMFITNDEGASNSYSDVASTVHFYREISLPANAIDIVINYSVKCAGRSPGAWLWVSSSHEIPVAGSTQNFHNHAIVYETPNAATGAWTTYTIDSTSSSYNVLLTNATAGTTNLIFSWINSSSTNLVQPPAAIEYIKLTYTIPATPGLSYILNPSDDTYIVLIGTADDQPHIMIPATHEGLPVRHIAAQGFWNNSILQSIFMPDSIQHIRAAAFMNTPNLTDVRFSDGLITILDMAFLGSGLTSVNIPASVVQIEHNSFRDCFDIETFTVEAGNTVYHAAGNCLIWTAPGELVVGFNTSVIPGGVNIIGHNAFSRMRMITSVTIPNTVTYIGMSAFWGCDSLTTVSLSTNLIEIDESAFENCVGLSTIFIPITVTNMGCNAFAGCSNLTLNVAAVSKPESWSDDWNPDDRPVNWGVVPSVVTLIAPTHNDTGLANDQMLAWASATGVVSGYKIYLGTTLPLPLVATTHAETTFAPTLLGNTTYHWRIVAFNSFGDGLSSPTWTFTVGSVSDKDDVGMVSATRLKGNYPNPFNPETSVRFTVGNATSGRFEIAPTSMNIVIDVFNIRGQKVRSLVNAEFSIGEYSIVWDGTDDQGHSVGSGVYFYRMVSNEYTETRKMILLK
jgi:hypothetical protein